MCVCVPSLVIASLWLYYKESEWRSASICSQYLCRAIASACHRFLFVTDLQAESRKRLQNNTTMISIYKYPCLIWIKLNSFEILVMKPLQRNLPNTIQEIWTSIKLASTNLAGILLQALRCLHPPRRTLASAPTETGRRAPQRKNKENNENKKKQKKTKKQKQSKKNKKNKKTKKHSTHKLTHTYTDLTLTQLNLHRTYTKVTQSFLELTNRQTRRKLTLTRKLHETYTRMPHQTYTHLHTSYTPSVFHFLFFSCFLEAGGEKVRF